MNEAKLFRREADRFTSRGDALLETVTSDCGGPRKWVALAELHEAVNTFQYSGPGDDDEWIDHAGDVETLTGQYLTAASPVTEALRSDVEVDVELARYVRRASVGADDFHWACTRSPVRAQAWPVAEQVAVQALWKESTDVNASTQSCIDAGASALERHCDDPTVYADALADRMTSTFAAARALLDEPVDMTDTLVSVTGTLVWHGTLLPTVALRWTVHQERHGLLLSCPRTVADAILTLLAHGRSTLVGPRLDEHSVDVLRVAVSLWRPRNRGPLRDITDAITAARSVLA